ncbi:XRE family transcriptional regulator [Hydrogenimonas thermophila]|uniref:Phage repressor protein C, contains Cro/C1-type HTH and peptisase s24 domains n=1 Tax=Hydrogenimonas thermophila TaxID=223786 RepID=A0A1I5RSV8_9BACT|nr:LexA family transcriptional regulator [Hydrogenimonas thermophila]SFP61605.1 Phage repressor protein C, contains Cro/C1-type HTH and peptisase s24 domains [Hydrogenimonas thermophila]
MSGGERLKKVRKHLGLTQQQFADKLGIKWHKIKDIEIGKNKMSVEIADLIREKYSISFDWLLTGKGTMIPENKTNNTIEVNYYPDIYASAGGGAQNFNFLPQKIELSVFLLETLKIINPKKIELINILGDSMEPFFKNGDIAIIEKVDELSEIKNGDTVIINIQGDIYIKKIEKIPFKNTLILKSNNPIYEDIVLQDMEVEDIKIIAIVRGKLKSI